MISDVFSGDGDDSVIDTMSDEEEDVNNKIATECLKRKKELLELMTECGEERMQIWKTLMLNMIGMRMKMSQRLQCRRF